MMKNPLFLVALFFLATKDVSATNILLAGELFSLKSKNLLTYVPERFFSDAMKANLRKKQPYVYATKEIEAPYSCAEKQGALQTFKVPNINEASDYNKKLGREFVRALRTDGILQVAINEEMNEIVQAALSANREFCKMPFSKKSNYVSRLSYSGYVASGEEQTDGKSDASEIFTITPDIPSDDILVKKQIPCHGPTPWPNDLYRDSMKNYMSEIGKIGDNLVNLVSLGLGLEIDKLSEYSKNGWHHMRVLRFPSEQSKSTKVDRGIGAHTDYGFLVIASQDDVGGLYIRPPVNGELRLNNWLEGNSMAGMYEDEEPWTFVKPVPNVLTVFPGDMLQLITNGYLLSTPHKVALHPTKERFALAYFHEPKFTSTLRTLKEFSNVGEGHSISYGKHFTNMFMRCYPDRITTKQIIASNGLSKLESLFSDL